MRGSRYVAALALALTACGGDGTVEPAATTAAPAPTTPAAPTSAQPVGVRALGEALREAAIATEVFYSDYGTYKGLTEQVLVTQGYERVPGVTIRVVASNDTRYCLAATSGTQALYLDSNQGRITDQRCR